MIDANDQLHADRMPSRYIPPALRQKAVQDENSPAGGGDLQPSRLDRDDQHTTLEIQRYFWPPDDSEDPPATKPHSTLNASATTPHRLSHIILFHGANPRWASDQIIFAKTNIELLQPLNESTEPPPLAEAQGPDLPTSGVVAQDTEEIATAESAPNPIAVFEQQHGSGGQSGRNFKFTGWFRLQKLDILRPNSPGLIRMLEQKWQRPTANRFGSHNPRQREPAAWQASLNHTWAVLKLVLDQETNHRMTAPKIPRLADETFQPTPARRKGNGTKSVNELLAELRVKQDDKSPPGGALDASDNDQAYVPGGT